MLIAVSHRNSLEGKGSKITRKQNLRNEIRVYAAGGGSLVDTPYLFSPLLESRTVNTKSTIAPTMGTRPISAHQPLRLVTALVLHFWNKCYTFLMPTTRPRHMITETDQLSDALVEAAKIWPELADQRALLLRKVLEVGIETIETRATEQTKIRLAKVQKIAGSMDGVWPANWKKELAEDWPG